ncbi:uncharacterized protein G2W53_032972 [Senna tora]|uniref:Uncharacterized protein n=1 Tax=Senna tora TaxID=362788 RepID=A0A834T077_9FABA|nr:uncharacterized protein G2W53_032972 [Senna tora]
MLPIRPLCFPNQQYRASVVQRNQVLHRFCSPSRALLCWKFLNSESGVSLSLTASRGRDPKPQPSVYFLLACPSRSHLIAIVQATADWGFWGWKKHAAFVVHAAFSHSDSVCSSDKPNSCSKCQMNLLSR